MGNPYKNLKPDNRLPNSNLGDDSFEQMLDLVFTDMISRHTDPEVERMKNIYSYNSEEDTSKTNLERFIDKANPLEIAKKIGVEVSKRVATYPEMFNNFVSGGKWDHKVQGREMLDSFYHKTDKNKEGQSAVIFGGKIPGDDENIYDHDLWGNISYGYTQRAAGMSDFEARAAAVIDDIRQIPQSRRFDLNDDDMVKVGVMLYDKYGDKMTKEDLRREIIANKKEFRKYHKDMLEKRSLRSQRGEDLEQIAKRENVSVEDIKKQLKSDTLANPKLYGKINDETSLIEGLKVNIPRKEDRQPQEITPLKPQNINAQILAKPQSLIKSVTPTKDDDKEAQALKILESFQKSDNKAEDILFKNSSDITYDEMIKAKKAAMFEIKDQDIANKVQNKINDFYDTFYSKNNVRQDEFGKMIQPKEIKPFPEKELELKTKDNIPMVNAFKQLAQRTAENGVQALQRGLNIFGINPALKEDGVVGAKTTSRAKSILANNGVSAVENNINIGAFEKLVEDNKKREIPQDSLNGAVSKIGLSAGKTLQQGINNLGQRKEGFQKLKEDNDIGPVTTAAFNQIKDEDEDEIKTSFRAVKNDRLEEDNQKILI